MLTKITIGLELLRRRFLNERKPVLVSWSVTNRCNLKCVYCEHPNLTQDELDTDGALALIDDLAKSKVRLMALTGGEPLVREDIDNLITRAKSKNIIISINTNGLLVKEKLHALKKVDMVQLSIDGPGEINDALRGQGAFDVTKKALLELGRIGKKVKLNVTITNKLMDHLNELLEICKSWDAPVMFHPLSTVHSGDMDISGIKMYEKQLYKIIGEIIQAKKKGYRIMNSFSGLNRLRGVPKRLPPKCYAGVLSLAIMPDGRMVICNQKRTVDKPVDIFENGFLEGVKSLPSPQCHQCWCANPMEFNLAMSLNLETILSGLKQKI